MDTTSEAKKLINNLILERSLVISRLNESVSTIQFNFEVKVARRALMMMMSMMDFPMETWGKMTIKRAIRMGQENQCVPKEPQDIVEESRDNE